MTYLYRPNSGPFVDETTNRSVSDDVCDDTLFHQIERLADRMTTMRCRATPSAVHLEPASPGGLPVSVDKSGGRSTMAIGSWYDDVDDDTAVLSLVEKAISGQLRLRMEGDGKMFHTFAVEIRMRNGGWTEMSQMAGYWFRKRPTRIVKYLCNELADCR